MKVLLAVLLGAGLGGFVQAVTGFGAAVVMMTVLPYFFDMTLAPSISTSICFGLTTTLAWKFRKHVKRELVLLPTICYGLASITAIRLIGAMDLHILTIAFGVLLFLLGGYFLFGAKHTKIRVSVPFTIFCGLLGGACGGLFSIGGPIMALYFLAAAEGRNEYIGNMQTHFAMNNFVSLSARIANGYYMWRLLPLTVLGVFGVVCGQRVGLKLGEKLNAGQLRTVVYAYVMLSGAITVIQQLLSSSKIF